MEVTASAELAAPSRLPPTEGGSRQSHPGSQLHDYRGKIPQQSACRQQNGRLARRAVGYRGSRRFASLLSGIAALAGRLRFAGVSDDTARRWLDRLEAQLTCDPECHADRLPDRLRQIVAAELPIRGAIRLASNAPTVVALVGPTGVGKTTTMAKLPLAVPRTRAAERRARNGRYLPHCRRQQLRTYAQIMDLPMEVVATPREMTAALHRLSEYDLILIDTAGRQSCATRFVCWNCGRCLAAAQPHDIPVVLSSVADVNSLCLAAKAFGNIGATSIILSKLDEAAQLTTLPDCLAACGLPLSYTTHGQNVPDDIRPASASELARLIVTGVLTSALTRP